MTAPLMPVVTGAGQVEQRPGIAVCGSSGTLDTQRMKRKAQLVRSACDIAAVAKRYQNVHHVVFGFSVRRILYALKIGKLTDFPALEIELDSIEAASKSIQRTMSNAGFDGLPRRAKTAIAIRDALEEYSKALSDAALNLNLICRSLYRESQGETRFTDYSAGQFRNDRAAYDASVQEFRRWGARLTELFKKF